MIEGITGDATRVGLTLTKENHMVTFQMTKLCANVPLMKLRRLRGMVEAVVEVLRLWKANSVSKHVRNHFHIWH